MNCMDSPLGSCRTESLLRHPRLVPGIHVFRAGKAWIAGTSPAMTNPNPDLLPASGWFDSLGGAAVRGQWGRVFMAGRFRVGCDIGGTFTDFVLIETATGEIRTAKRLTTPEDPSVAMLAGLTEIARAVPGSTAAAERLAHATTLVANAVIERNGA